MGCVPSSSRDLSNDDDPLRLQSMPSWSAIDDTGMVSQENLSMKLDIPPSKYHGDSLRDVSESSRGAPETAATTPIHRNTSDDEEIEADILAEFTQYSSIKTVSEDNDPSALSRDSAPESNQSLSSLNSQRRRSSFNLLTIPWFHRAPSASEQNPTKPETTSPHSQRKLRHYKKSDFYNRALFWASLLSLLGNTLSLCARFGYSLLYGTSTDAKFTVLLYALSGILFLLLFAHRLVAYIASGLLRRWLRRSMNNNGQFDIHIGWISYRGLLDKNQLVLHDIMWLNHPAFTKTPFLLHAREISVSFTLRDMFELARFGKILKMDEAVVDSLEVYFERADVEGERGCLNVWSAFGLVDHSKEKDNLRAIINGLFNLIVEKLGEKMFKRPMHSLLHGDKPYNPNPVLAVELQRLFVLDLLAHPLDLLSGCHNETSGIADIKIPLMYMTHKELSGKHGEALPGDEFGDRFGDGFAADLFKYNTPSITALLAAAGFNKAVHAARTHIFKHK